MTTQIVSSGVASDGNIISSGDELLVLSGGFADETTVLDGGTEILSSGATADDVTVSSGGLLAGSGLSDEIFDYGRVSGLRAGDLFVESGGFAQGDVISGGQEIVYSGGAALDETIEKGVFDTIYSGANVSGLTIRAGALAFDSGAVTSARVSSGGLLQIWGSAFDDVVSSGGAEYIASGAMVTSDTVLSGGTLEYGGDFSSGQIVSYTGSVDSTTLISGVTLSSGALLQLKGAKVLRGAVMSLTADAPPVSITVSAGGRLLGPGRVAAGIDFGLVSGVLLSSGGGLDVRHGGVALGDTIEGGEFDGGYEAVSSGGVAKREVIKELGEALVLAGGSDDNASVQSGGLLDDLGAVNGARVSSGGLIEVFGSARGVTILRGGVESFGVGASVSGDVVMNGGKLLFGERVTSGQTLSFGASVTSTTVLDGVTIAKGARVQLDGATILRGATVSLAAGALVASATVRAGGVLIGGGAVNGITDDGLVSGVVLTSGAAIDALVVESGGVASGVRVNAGAEEFVSAGLSVSSVIAGGSESVWSGGVARNDVVSHGSVFVGQGGVTVGDLIRSGGQEVDFEGAVSGASVVKGGVLMVTGGVTSGVHVLSGGIETLLPGGWATGSRAGQAIDGVVAGYEFDYGEASGTVVLSGGHESVKHGAKASGSVIDNGGREGVSSGGVTLATTVMAGGTLQVLSGGVVSSGLTLQGGEAIIAGEVGAGQTIDFAGAAGVLQLRNLAGFHAMISGLHTAAQKIDLYGFAFTSGETATWAQSGTSGTLTVTDGSQSARLTLIGTYAASDFKLTQDPHGATFVADPSGPEPAAAATAVTRFAESVAGLHGGRYQAGADAIQPGGTTLLSASQSLTAPTSGR